MSDHNPYLEAEADTNSELITREDCWFDVDEEDTLHDAYLILRDAGHSQDDLQPVLELITRTTIYDGATVEQFYTDFVSDE